MAETDNMGGLPPELIGEEPTEAKTGKKKAGRPAGKRNTKQREAAEAAFVAAYLEHGGSASAAYKSLHPQANTNTARKEGHRWLKREGVKRELKARRDEAREIATERSAYDLEKAHEELCKRIEVAADAGQHSAVASMIREKMKLWKLIEHKDAIAQAGFSITINSPDGETRVVGTTDGDNSQ